MGLWVSSQIGKTTKEKSTKRLYSWCQNSVDYLKTKCPMNSWLLLILTKESSIFLTCNLKSQHNVVKTHSLWLQIWFQILIHHFTSYVV